MSLLEISLGVLAVNARTFGLLIGITGRPMPNVLVEILLSYTWLTTTTSSMNILFRLRMTGLLFNTAVEMSISYIMFRNHKSNYGR